MEMAVRLAHYRAWLILHDKIRPVYLRLVSMDPGTRMMKRVEIEDALEADRIFTILMGDKVAPRREFIETHSASLDLAQLDI
jgi:DNA gyrase subunit B